jgi:Zn-dependent protease/predicted transcriptional regulator
MIGGGFRIGAVWGIEVRLDLSVAVIFSLVVYSLGAEVFPSWHENWDGLTTWLTALSAGLLFFASLLAHELAHSVVAKLRGIAVPRITLFVFGGVSQMEREPDTPASEFLIAIVGPAMSGFLGFFFMLAGSGLAGDLSYAELAADPESAMASLSPVATLFMWLGPVNLILAVFNLVPGFPLDGGRVLRAALWQATNDLDKATQWAANAGRGVAWGIMAIGALSILRGNLLQGLWLMLIGWFLYSAARSSPAQLYLRQALERLSVRDLMRTRFEVVQSDVPLERFLSDYLLRSGQPTWPVVDDEILVGLISFDDVAKLPVDQRARVRVADVMQPISDRIEPHLGGEKALEALVSAHSDPMPVTEYGRVVGLLHRSDIMRWLALHHLKASGASRQSGTSLN